MRTTLNDPEASEATMKAHNDEQGAPCPLSLLPIDVQRRVFSFLNPMDAMVASNLRVFPNGIVVRPLTPERHLCAGKLLEMHRLPMVAKVSHGIVHSVTFRAQWKIGEKLRDGDRVLIVATRQRGVERSDAILPIVFEEEAEDTYQYPYGAGQVVAKTTKMVPNEWGCFELSFTPCEGFVYYLKFASRGISLQNGFLQSYVYDNMDSSFSKTFQVLHNLNVISCSQLLFASPPNVTQSLLEFEYVVFLADTPEVRATRRVSGLVFPNFILRCIQQGLVNCDILQDHPTLDPILKDMFDAGLPINERTLQAAEIILRTFIDELNYDWDDYEGRWHAVDDNLRFVNEDENEEENSQNSEDSDEDDSDEDDSDEDDESDDQEVDHQNLEGNDEDDDEEEYTDAGELPSVTKHPLPSDEKSCLLKAVLEVFIAFVLFREFRMVGDILQSFLSVEFPLLPDVKSSLVKAALEVFVSVVLLHQLRMAGSILQFFLG